jgi:uncharacterized repeat protein (TIGR01451 family)
VPVLIPALTMTKSAGTGTTTPGATVGYTVTITNSGQTPYAAATVTDRLDDVVDDASYAGGTATRGVLALTGSTLTWTGDLDPGQTAVVTYGVLVSSPAMGDKVMVNRVESGELGSGCPPGAASASCSAVVTVLLPALDVAIAADSATTVPGGTVGYTVTVRNSGQTDYAGATVTASLAGVLDDAAYPGSPTPT